MTSKEWVEEQLSYTDDHWTTTDKIMLNKIFKDLERLEQLEKENQELKKKEYQREIFEECCRRG